MVEQNKNRIDRRKIALLTLATIPMLSINSPIFASGYQADAHKRNLSGVIGVCGYGTLNNVAGSVEHLWTNIVVYNSGSSYVELGVECWSYGSKTWNYYVS